MAEKPKNKSPDLREQDGAARPDQSQEHAEMIPQASGAVKRANWLREFHVRSGLKSAELVELIRPLCPGFDKSLLVKCENPDRYGVQLSQRVIRLLKKHEEEKHA